MVDSLKAMVADLSHDPRAPDLKWLGDKPIIIYSGFATEEEAKDSVPRWIPIPLAPVPPREELMHGRWPCLLQDKKGNVVAGYAAYLRSRAESSIPDRRHQRKPPDYHIQWYSGSNPLHAMNRVFKPVYWMPLPAPRTP